jgi:hypothetical protein
MIRRVMRVGLPRSRAACARAGPFILLGSIVVLLATGCGGDKSPTEPRSLAEARQAEQSVQIADVIDALFLGTGPLIPRDGLTGCPTQAVWSGYPRGTALRVRVSSRVPPSALAAIELAAGPIPDATGRALTVVVETTSDPDPRPGVNEVTVTEHALPRAAGCRSDGGCVQYRFAGRGLLMSVQVVEGPGRSAGAYTHDVVGRAILGLCALDSRRIGGVENSLMSGGPGVSPGDGAPTLTGLDLKAIRTVYASSLSPGAVRAAFLGARLVNLQAGQLPRPR